MQPNDHYACVVEAAFKAYEKSLSSCAHICVGYSGGVDSTCLLHLASRLSLAGRRIKVTAVHVDHGISDQSGNWADFCSHQAQSRYLVNFYSQRVNVKPSPQGVEGAARTLRWQVYHAVADSSEEPVILLLGHHADDQAETFLLQLMRGAGLNGLKSISSMRQHADFTVMRPFLGLKKSQLVEYAKRYDLAYIEDQSNSDISLDRNYLRHVVLPALLQRWQAACSNIVRSAHYIESDWKLLAEYARSSLQSMLYYRNGIPVFDCGAFLQQSTEKKILLLRVYLLDQGWYVPSHAQLLCLVGQIDSAKTGSSVELKTKQYRIILYQAYLYIFSVDWFTQQPMDFTVSSGCHTITYSAPCEICIRFDWKQILGNNPVQQSKEYEVVFLRHSRARIMPKNRVKRFYQSNRVPPFLRSVTPILLINDRMVYIDFHVISAKFC